MKKVIREIVSRGIQGAVLGVFLLETIGTVMMFFTPDAAGPEKSFLLAQYVTGLLAGFAFGALNLLFQVEKLGIAGATALHFVGVSAVFFPLSLAFGWFPGSAEITAATFALFGITYFGVWLVCYLRWKAQVNKINRHLHKIH